MRKRRDETRGLFEGAYRSLYAATGRRGFRLGRVNLHPYIYPLWENSAPASTPRQNTVAFSNASPCITTRKSVTTAGFIMRPATIFLRAFNPLPPLA